MGSRTCFQYIAELFNYREPPSHVSQRPATPFSALGAFCHVIVVFTLSKVALASRWFACALNQ